MASDTRKKCKKNADCRINEPKCTMKPNTILSRKGTIISGKMDEAGSPEYTKQKGLDKKNGKN